MGGPVCRDLARVLLGGVWSAAGGSTADASNLIKDLGLQQGSCQHMSTVSTHKPTSSNPVLFSICKTSLLTPSPCPHVELFLCGDFQVDRPRLPLALPVGSGTSLENTQEGMSGGPLSHRGAPAGVVELEGVPFSLIS